MANVIQCDICGEVCRVNDTWQVRLYKHSETEHLDNLCNRRVDVCPICYARILQLLNPEERK